MSGSKILFGAAAALVIGGLSAFAQQLPSPAFNNVTVIGDLALPPKAGNTIMAAPASGSGAPTFRSMVGSDLPADQRRAGGVNVGSTDGNPLVLSTGNTSRWNVGGVSGHLLPATDSTYDLGSASHRIANAYVNALTTTTQPLSDNSAKAATTAFVKDSLARVDVREFGAKCDNSTDDATAIQNAISAAVSNVKQLFFPRGSCVVGSKLLIEAPIDIVSDPSANIRFTNASSCGFDLDFRAASANFGLNSVSLPGLYSPSFNASFQFPGYPVGWSSSQRSSCDAITLKGGSRINISAQYIAGFNAAVKLSATYDGTNGARAPQNINVRVNTIDLVTYALYLDGGPANAGHMVAIDTEFNTAFAKFPVYFDVTNNLVSATNTRITGQTFVNEAGGSCVYGAGTNIAASTVMIRWCYAGHGGDSPSGTATDLTVPYLSGNAASNGQTTDGNATTGYFVGYNNEIHIGAAVDVAGLPGGYLPAAGRVTRVRDAGVNNKVTVGYFERSQGSALSLVTASGEAGFGGGVGAAPVSRLTYVSMAVPSLTAGQSATFFAYSSLLSANFDAPLEFLQRDEAFAVAGLRVTVKRSASVNREMIIIVSNPGTTTVSAATYYGWIRFN